MPIEPQRTLFHYTTQSAFLAYILPSRRLRLSELARLNDPRESMDWSLSLSDDAEVASEAKFDFFEIVAQLNRAMRSGVKILCLTQDDPDYDPDSINWQFGPGYAHPSMWDRYAQGHSGVCLGFDRIKLIESFKTCLGERGTLLHAPVRYSDSAPGDMPFTLATSALSVGIERAALDHAAARANSLFFRKYRDWSPENEYRLLLLDTEHDDAYIEIEAALTHIVFGANFPHDAIRMIDRALLPGHVAMHMMRYSNGAPQLFPWIRGQM
ncbi:DUF2971 domain-containing protein [Terracoccus sp. 273MFTsu3.1]|uniref:DUF2971 domain-containing protein n=1 Tax=Terracoccus sp. 273MFTsu3.1 TaxID=1172188 RepID=UPI0018C92908|nr:DUF2971 domain-containing protein [Terracoccus sp. 273MFTsu3.1]